MHSVRSVEPSIWDTNTPRPLQDSTKLIVREAKTEQLWYLWSEVPQNQPTTGPSGAVSTPRGACYVEETQRGHIPVSVNFTKLVQNQNQLPSLKCLQ